MKGLWGTSRLSSRYPDPGIGTQLAQARSRPLHEEGHHAGTTRCSIEDLRNRGSIPSPLFFALTISCKDYTHFQIL